VKLAATLPDLHFVMIGRGLSREVLEGRGLKITENLRVFGEVSHAQAMDAVAASSAVVVTSKREGLPTLVLEAMTLGKPVVVPNERGCLEAIGENGLGFVYDPPDIGDLAAKTTAAFGDTSKAKERRDHVLKEYDWRVVAPQLDAIYSGAQTSGG
jgi:glycosyltransferase involved in cell wall biosynthesis